MRESTVCAECVVTYILFGSAESQREEQTQETDKQPPVGKRPKKSDSVVIDAEEFFALRRLQAAGLVPELRHDKPISSDIG